MKYLTILAAILILVTGLTACSNAAPVATTPTVTPQNNLIEVVEVTGPIPPINPGGPNVKIILKNRGTEPFTAMGAMLLMVRPYEYDFPVTKAKPLSAGQSISLEQTLIGATINTGDTYILDLTATMQSGAVVQYSQRVTISPPAN